MAGSRWEMPLLKARRSRSTTPCAATRACSTLALRRSSEGGGSALAFLRHALANDVDRLRLPGKALYSCLLAEDGGVLDDLIVYRLAEDRYRIVLNAATAASDLVWLGRLCPAGTSLRARHDLAMLAVQGPRAREKSWLAFAKLRAAGEALGVFFGVQAGDIFVARTGYTGEDGVELLLPAAQAADAWQRLRDAGVRPCGLGARNAPAERAKPLRSDMDRP